MRVAKIQKYDTAQWDGINTSIFFTGCTHKCPGCFNNEIQSFDAGELFDKTKMELLVSYVLDSQVKGLCVLGGEPFQQDLDALYDLLYIVKTVTNKPIHVWTGYTLEELVYIQGAYKVLSLCDTLVDGRFILAKKDLSLKFRGSSNQRVIDVQQSLLKNETILLNV